MPLETLQHLSLLVHLIGLGMISTLLFAGPVLEKRFQAVEDVNAKLELQKILRTIGLLSPLAVAVLLISGIGNMLYGGYGLFSSGWLTAKIIFFAIAVVNGAVMGARGGKRGKLIQQLVRGEVSGNAAEEIQAMNKQQLMFYRVQTLLILIIVILSVFKPG